jgi:hypothetical protein
LAVVVVVVMAVMVAEEVLEEVDEEIKAVGVEEETKAVGGVEEEIKVPDLSEHQVSMGPDNEIKERYIFGLFVVGRGKTNRNICRFSIGR